MIERDQFGPELRRERERRGVTLQDIARRTKIGASLFAALERNDFSRWPGGIYGRSFVRAYAEAIGIDAERTVDDFVRLFPPDEEGSGQHTSAAVASHVEPERALHLVASNPQPGARAEQSARHRLMMAGVEMAVVGTVGAGIGLAVDWFYAWPALGFGALVVAAANIRRRKPTARPAAVQPVVTAAPAQHARHAAKRRAAEPKDTSRRHRPRRPPQRRPPA